MKKRALVLAGGGSKGSYEVGVMKYLIGDKSYQYDIISGVSVGALNASFLAQYPIGQEKEALANLESIWDHIKESDVYHNHRPFGKLEALWKPSVYDSSPLKSFVQKNLDPEKVKVSGRELRISACSLMSGQVRIWTEKDSTLLREGVLASSSFPIMLDPIEIDGELYTDAGVKEIAPMNVAIKAGADIVDVVVTSPLKSQPWALKHKKRKPNAIKVLMRSIELMTDEILLNDLIKMEEINQQILNGTANPKYRYIEVNIYQPKEVLLENSLKFDRNILDRMKQIGYEIGKSHEQTHSNSIT